MADAIVPQDFPASRKAAQTTKAKHYFTGKPCAHGHVALRYTSIGKCIVCAKIDCERDRQENPEKQLEYGRTSRAKHGDKMRAYHRDYMKRNPEKNRANVARWKKANPDKVAAKSARYHQKHQDRINARNRAYHRANPHIANASARRRRAKLSGAEGSHTAAEILQLAARQKYRCACCKTSIKRGYHADHIMPLALGGSDYIANIQLLCALCNRRKAAKHPIDWAQQNGRLL